MLAKDNHNATQSHYMYQMNEKTMTIEVSLEELENLCRSALKKKGASSEEASIVFQDYLDAELRGRTSHGFVSFAVALGAFPHAGKYEIVEDSLSHITIEGNGDCGHVVARKSIDHGLENLKKTKVCTIGIRNITRFNCPGSIARYAAENGAIALVLEYGGKNFMVPFGGKEASLSTNPIGIAIPGTNPLFVLDIATSERAIGFVNLAKASGEFIPNNWGVDKFGQATTNPSELAAMNPFGGYKGSALAMAFEILSGALVGVPIGSSGDLSKRGALILLFDPTIFGQTKEEFQTRVAKFLEEVTSTAPQDASAPVMYPGQLGENRYQDQIKKGKVVLPKAILDSLSNF